MHARSHIGATLKDKLNFAILSGRQSFNVEIKSDITYTRTFILFSCERNQTFHIFRAISNARRPKVCKSHEGLCVKNIL